MMREKKRRKVKDILENHTCAFATIVYSFRTYSALTQSQLQSYLSTNWQIRVGSSLSLPSTIVARDSEAGARTCCEDSRCSHKMHRPGTKAIHGI